MTTGATLWDAMRQTEASLGGRGELTEADLKDFGEATKRIYELMKDLDWHTATEIIAASGQREGLRRMRVLRQKYKIDKRRLDDKDSREYEYRLQEV